MSIKTQNTTIILHGLSVNSEPKKKPKGIENNIVADYVRPDQDLNTAEIIIKGIPASSINFSEVSNSETNHSGNKILAHVTGAIATGVSGAVFAAAEKLPELIVNVKRINQGKNIAVLIRKLSDAGFAVNSATVVDLKPNAIGGNNVIALEISKDVTSKNLEKTSTKLIEKVFKDSSTPLIVTSIKNKPASILTASLPFVGTAINTAITAWDAHDAIKKQNNPYISNTSKALAWATVGLDVISTGAQAITATSLVRGNINSSVTAGIVSITASSLSIATSLASDYLK